MSAQGPSFDSFQYRICAIAIVIHGHQATCLTVSLWHLYSAYSLAAVLNVSIALYLHCCFWVKWFEFACLVSVSMQWGNCCWLNFSCSSSLYLWMMQGSLHFNHLALSGTNSGVLNQPSTTKGGSIHNAWWLLGIPLPNAKWPDADCMRLVGRKMPSIGFCPWLWVFGPFTPCCKRITSDNPICQKVEWMGSSLMSLLMSEVLSLCLPHFARFPPVLSDLPVFGGMGIHFSLFWKPLYLLLISCEVHLLCRDHMLKPLSENDSIGCKVWPSTSNLNWMDHLPVLSFCVTDCSWPTRLCLPVESHPHGHLFIVEHAPVVCLPPSLSFCWSLFVKM